MSKRPTAPSMPDRYPQPRTALSITGLAAGRRGKVGVSSLVPLAFLLALTPAAYGTLRADSPPQAPGDAAASNCVIDDDCDDGMFCNGVEICNPVNHCEPGDNPCAGQDCDEVGDQCVQTSGVGFVGIVVEDITASLPLCANGSGEAVPEPLVVCNVFAEFASPSDRLLYMGFSDITTDDPNGYYQHPFGSDSAPYAQIVELFPDLVCDSFVDIGFNLVPIGVSDGTSFDPDWNSPLFNTGGGTAGGWFNANPPNLQGDAGNYPDLRVFAAQFAVRPGFNVSGTMTVFFNTGIEPDIEVVQFTCEGAAQACTADLDDGDTVDAGDLAMLLTSWGPCPGCRPDLNDDGFVDAGDLALLLGAWGPSCDDGNDCSIDDCVAGFCQSYPSEAGTVCDNDDNLCTLDACDGAASCLQIGAVTCPAGECEAGGQCNPGTGLCDLPLPPAGTPCGDSADTDCDHPDTCDGFGTCVANLSPAGADCDLDADWCTIDLCDGLGECAYDHDVACLPDEVCLGGECMLPPPDMIFVPGGEFEMGDPWGEGEDDQVPVHTVYLSPYYFDAYEVTNQQYAEGLNWAWAQGLITVSAGVVYNAGATSYAYCTTTAAAPGEPEFGEHSRITWDSSTFGVVEGKQQHPIAMVSWYGAAAYCNWRSAMESRPLCYDRIDEDPPLWDCNFSVNGYRLPTEAEWEKAAGWDPVQQRHYRFGEHTDGCGSNCLSGQRANYAGSDDPYESGPGPRTAPVGFYNGELHHREDFGWPINQTTYQTQNAQSYYGAYDLSGNVWEWCNDWYSGTYYSNSPGLNPIGVPSGTYRVLRGGSYYLNVEDSILHCRSAHRDRFTPVARDGNGGFRCAAGSF